MSLNKSKIVVFDMDETMGYFVELGIFWDSLNNYIKLHNLDNKITINQEVFNSILDLFPEFLRPNIFTMFNYLKHKKISKQCQGIMIYTNNQGPKEWVTYIKNYFESKMNYKIFNHVISAFKINGKRIELCRSSHNKSMKDLIKCTKLPKDAEICYLDDTYYPEMNYESVYYIKVKPYIHDLDFDLMIKRFINSNTRLSKIIMENYDNDDFVGFMKENMNKYEFVYMEKDDKEYEIDKIITKKTMEHLVAFFNKKSHASTRKLNRKQSIRNTNKTNKQRTRKNYY
jgi:hypothetical protein